MAQVSSGLVPYEIVSNVVVQKDVDSVYVKHLICCDVACARQKACISCDTYLKMDQTAFRYVLVKGDVIGNKWQYIYIYVHIYICCRERGIYHFYNVDSKVNEFNVGALPCIYFLGSG